MPTSKSSRLDILRNQVMELAEQLGLVLVDEHPAKPRKLSASIVGYGKQGTRVTHAAPDRLTVAMAWVAARSSRDRVLGGDLFIDPAWNMVLDLYINHCRKRDVSVSDICLASLSPPTTALRWLTLLEHRKLMVRVPDKSDGRRWFVRFTDEGLEKVEKALDAASEGDHRLGLGRLRILQNVDDML